MDKKQAIIKAAPGASDETGLTGTLFTEIRRLIESARARVAVAVNCELVDLYGQVGKRIGQEVLKNQRAGYGRQIVSALSRQLSMEFGAGFSEKALRHMVRFAELYTQREVSALPREFGWSHLLEVLYLPDPLQREFYIQMCRMERWSTRSLRDRIRTMLYERTAVSKQPVKVIGSTLRAMKEEHTLAPELFSGIPMFWISWV